MATLLTLRTELAARMQRGTPGSDLTAQLNYAINSAKNKIVLGPPGQSGITKRDLVGETWGDYSPTGSIVLTKGSASGACASEALTSNNVFAGDILEVTISSVAYRYLIYSLTATTINIGAPWSRANATVTNANWKIYRRTVKLPTTGMVTGAALLDGNTTNSGNGRPGLRAAQDSAMWVSVETGDAEAYSTSYDPANDAAYFQLYPGPTSITRVVIQLTDVPADLSGDSADLDWPPPLLDLLLDKARETMLIWSNQNSEIVLAAAGMERRASAGSLQASSSPFGVLRR